MSNVKSIQIFLPEMVKKTKTFVRRNLGPPLAFAERQLFLMSYPSTLNLAGGDRSLPFYLISLPNFCKIILPSSSGVFFDKST